MRFFLSLTLTLTMMLALTPAHAGPLGPSVSDYDSIQAAIDANPGAMIFVPGGDHAISRAIQISKDGAGLWGPGRIIQTNPEQQLLKIEDCADVTIKDISLTRAEGAQDATAEGVIAINCPNILLEGLRINENRTRQGTIEVRKSNGATVRNCVIQNYKRVTIDDRTDDPELYNYAFRSIDGTGIVMRESHGITVEGNRVVEHRYLPTKELRDKYGLGDVTVMNDPPGKLASDAIIETRYTSNWHQGSGIIVTDLGKCEYSIVRGNYIENAGQGIDLHADYVTLTDNIVNGAMIGTKALHGSKHVLIANNQFSRVDLWGILLDAGTRAYAASPSEEGKPAVAENIEGGIVIANNIITKFGFGGNQWNWQKRRGGDMFNAITLGAGPFPETPVLHDVLITGNMVYDNGKDTVMIDGEPQVVPPRFFYALYIADGPRTPQNVHVANNLFHSGSQGICSIPLDDTNLMVPTSNH